MSQSEPAPHVYSSGAKRSEKLPMYRLIPKAFLRHVAVGLALGNTKYENGSPLTCNWRTGDLRFFLDVADHLTNHVADANQLLVQHGIDINKTITEAEDVKTLDLLRERNKARTTQMIEDLAHAAINCAFLIEVLENGQLTDMMLREAGATAPEPPVTESQPCNCILPSDITFVSDSAAAEGYNTTSLPDALLGRPVIVDSNLPEVLPNVFTTPLTLELGKRYVRRDGIVTDPLTSNDDEDYPFWDPTNETVYTPRGGFYRNGKHNLDLVCEYKELSDEATPAQAETEPTCEVPAQAFEPLFPGNTPSDAFPASPLHKTCRLCASACNTSHSRNYGLCLDCRDKIIAFCHEECEDENIFPRRACDRWKWSIDDIFVAVDIETTVSTDRVRNLFASLRSVRG